MNDIIIITPKAITYLKTTLTKDAVGIRFGVKDAGCSGLKYILEPAMQRNPDDRIFSFADDLNVFINKKDLPFIEGVTIDCVAEGINKVIKFINPNEKASCGCGESFSV